MAYDIDDLKIVSWNVNSLKMRMSHVELWIEKNKPLILCLQEVRCDECKLDFSGIKALGYNVICNSKGGRNGVATIYKSEFDSDDGFFKFKLLSQESTFSNQPKFNNEIEPRYLKTTFSLKCKYEDEKIINLVNIYVPNGRAISDPHYFYKLEFLRCLKKSLDNNRNNIICGDFNIAPRDCDVWDIDLFRKSGATHVTSPERDILNEFGMVDVIPTGQKVFTFWHYLNENYYKNRGMRIDLFLVDEQSDFVYKTSVDFKEREKEKPSDHTPLILTLSSSLSASLSS